MAEMDAFRFELNPSSADLPHCNAVLNGNVRTRSYVVNSYQTTLCVKSVARGSAWYRTPRGRYLVDAETFLVLNRGQEYSLEIAAGSDTETICPFFQPGFLGHVADCKSARPERLLDEPPTAGEDPQFFERLYSMKQGPVAARLEILRAGLHGPRFCRPWLEDQLYELAGDLLVLRDGARSRRSPVPGPRRGRSCTAGSIAPATTSTPALPTICRSPRSLAWPACRPIIFTAPSAAPLVRRPCVICKPAASGPHAACSRPPIDP